VEKTLADDLRRVRGKHGILFRLAAAAVDHPDETVRRALFPVVGEGTLRDLVCESEANELAFRARVRTVLRGSSSGHYRRMLSPLLGALEFRSNNAAYRPVIDALELLVRYAQVDGKRRYYGPEARVPVDGGLDRAVKRRDQLQTPHQLTDDRRPTKRRQRPIISDDLDTRHLTEPIPL
jgi:hypothetical protein